jgi:FKBP-type peptidyl-prolyl cis-trans isomerase FkpA
MFQQLTKVILLCTIAFFTNCNHLLAQKNKKAAPKGNSGMQEIKAGSGKNKAVVFEKYNDIIEYNMYYGGKTNALKEKDLVKMHVVQTCGDTVLMSTYRDLKGMPTISEIRPAGRSPQDFNALFLKMHIGDSLTIRFNADSVLTQGKPAYYKDGDELKMSFKAISFLTAKEKDSLDAEEDKFKQKQREYQDSIKQEHQNELDRLIPQEDSLIQAYCKKNLMYPKKTESGLYYLITKKGSGALPQRNQKVSVNYTGFFMGGKAFDSNTDPEFKHVSPFEFDLGTGMVISGWDEGIALLPIGTKAIFLIPSRLAYGERGREPNIDPNTVLRYEVEVMGVK